MTLSGALRELRAAGGDDLAGRLEAFVEVVARRAAMDAEFAADLAEAMGEAPTVRGGRLGGDVRRGGRRPPGPFDPFEAYAAGEDELRRRLGACDIEELRNIVAEHAMDYDRLALKWKTPDRLIERIVTTVSTRARKGDAFRSPGAR